MKRNKDLFTELRDLILTPEDIEFCQRIEQDFIEQWQKDGSNECKGPSGILPPNDKESPAQATPDTK